MNASFVLARIGALDLDRAAGLHRAAFAPMGERPWTRQDMAELLASPAGGGLILQIDGEDAGVVLWRTIADEAELLTHRRRCRGTADAASARALLGQVIDAFTSAGRAPALPRGRRRQSGRPLALCTGRLHRSRTTRRLTTSAPTGFADALVLRLTLTSGG